MNRHKGRETAIDVRRHAQYAAQLVDGLKACVFGAIITAGGAVSAVFRAVETLQIVLVAKFSDRIDPAGGDQPFAEGFLTRISDRRNIGRVRRAR